MAQIEHDANLLGSALEQGRLAVGAGDHAAIDRDWETD